MGTKTPPAIYDTRLLDDALGAFTRMTGFEAEVVQHEPDRPAARRPDAEVQIEANRRRFRFFADIKAVDRVVALAAAKHQLEPYGPHGILVAPYLTPELANHC